MKNKHEGYCRLCGTFTKLTYEHNPPKSAFNDSQQIFQTMQDLMSNRRNSKFRQGIGKYSLCEKCNNLTGAWYGTSFVSWTRQGFEWISKLEAGTKISLPFHIQPLNVVKQVLVMALAMTSEHTLDYHYELRRFLLNKDTKYLPPKYLVHVYFNRNGEPRFASDMVISKVDNNSMSYVEAEVALPPFGYCVTKSIKNTLSIAQNEGLSDITWFSQFDYNIWTTVYLEIPLRETNEPFPLDYRTKEEVDEHHRKMGVETWQT
jgi:hypothetical protein